MTENQKLKMEILKEFAIVTDPSTIDTCRKIYQFLTEDEPAPDDEPTTTAQE